jgi:hypothetical protein
MILENIFAEEIGEKCCAFKLTYSYLCRQKRSTVFLRKKPFFHQK